MSHERMLNLAEPREQRTPRSVGHRLVMALLMTSAVVMFLAGCGDDAVSSSSVDQALHLMTGQAQPACVTDMDYGDGDATFRCGDYLCWTTAHASDHGVGHIIEGADYYDCDNRYAKGNDAAYQTWEKCVVDTDQRMSVLSKHECNMRGWMPGSEIGGF